jgi:hypothetical protein
LVLACLYRLGIKRGVAHSNPIFRWSWGSPLAAPAYSALLPTLVEPEDRANPISMNSIRFNLAHIISLIVIKGAIRGT